MAVMQPALFMTSQEAKENSTRPVSENAQRWDTQARDNGTISVRTIREPHQPPLLEPPRGIRQSDILLSTFIEIVDKTGWDC